MQSKSDENDDGTADIEEDFAESPKPKKYEGDDGEDEIIESDIELDGDTVEPDNDPPQKVENSYSILQYKGEILRMDCCTADNACHMIRKIHINFQMSNACLKFLL